MRLDEVRIMNSVHPTDNQKRVLAKIAAAPTPTVASEYITGDQNLIEARNQLMRLGLITVVNGEAGLTDRGRQVAMDENIIDQSGQLTDTGKAFASTSAKGGSDAEAAGNVQNQNAPIGPALDPGATGPTPTDGKGAMESFSLLKELLR